MPRGEGQRPVFTIRLGDAERRLIELAADARGESLAAYFRRSATTAAREEIASGAGSHDPD